MLGAALAARDARASGGDGAAEGEGEDGADDDDADDGGPGRGGGEAQDLVRETAHNLARMCASGGASELARALTRCFNTV